MTRRSGLGSAHRRDGRIERELDDVGSDAELIEGFEDCSRKVGGERDGEHARLHAADVEQIGDQRREHGERLVGGRDELVVIGGAQRRPRRTQAADGRDGRGERAAQVVADRRQRRRAHLVGGGQGVGGAGRLRELAVFQSCGELGGDDIEEASFRGADIATVQLERGARAPAASVPTGTTIARPSRAGSPSVASTCWVDPSPASRRPRSRRTPRGCG